MKIGYDRKESKISDVEITNDTLSGRGGLSFILRYLDRTGFLPMIEEKFGHLRKSGKGESISECARQFISFCMDGTKHSIARFDELKKDPGYAAVIERDVDELLSTASMKRFFSKFNGNSYSSYRSLLNELFIWRLKQEKPSVVVLHLDTMVLDNNGAKVREGCNVTYKKVLGFQPLQINWGPYIVDMQFRSGEKHSNHGNDAKEAVARLVRFIRGRYDEQVPIILNADSGFLSDENLQYFENELKIKYVVIGKLYSSVYKTLQSITTPVSARVKAKRASWVCYDFMSKLDRWETSRRTILTTLVADEDQYVLEGIRDTVMYTNLGNNDDADGELKNRNRYDLLQTEAIVKLAHHNGEEELNHRSIKEFMGSEHLPFTHFGMNGAYYSLMVISHFLMESFRKDIAGDIIPQRCYATRIRREIIDIAVKVVHTGHRIILKTTRSVWELLDIGNLWIKCNSRVAIT
ncbi:IS1380 family transposase [Chitinispirillales bacterium ANBcel5]|uniref:IS1380 family transposase n=1 Tax=Cellulosispirillum alkaliphilum TaxID=3039283 RepID=UPI002A56B417|nr:IS1380 family transposase [Chitinispirillales bacterium ANBcel5]